METTYVIAGAVAVIGAAVAATTLSKNCTAKRGERDYADTRDAPEPKKGKKQQKGQQQQPQQQQQPPKQQQQQKKAPEAKPAPAPAPAPAKQEAKAAPVQEKKDTKNNNKQQQQQQQPQKQQQKQNAKAEESEVELLRRRLQELEQASKSAPAPVAAAAAAGGEGKKKKKNKNKEGGASVAASTSSTGEVANPAPAVSETVLAQQQAELDRIAKENQGWTTVSRKSKKDKPATPAVDEASSSSSSSKKDGKAEAKEEKKDPKRTANIKLTDPNQRRVLIGPNGETMKKIKEKAPEVTINVPKADEKENNKVAVTGPPEQVSVVERIVHELLTRGYSKTLNPEFGETQIQVPDNKKAFVIGPQGARIKAIQEKTNTRVNFPTKESSNNFVMITGDQDGVRVAREAIKSIMEFGYCSLLDPNYTRLDVPFGREYHKKLVGNQGQRIQALQKALQVRINIPPSGAEDVDKVTIVGPRDLLPAAHARLLKLHSEFSTPTEEVYADGFEQGVAAQPDW